MRNTKHLKFIDSLPCLFCGGQSTHHHLLRVGCEFLQPTAETAGLMFPKIKSKGVGTKSDDRFCLPVCPYHHQIIHQHGNDVAFLKMCGIEESEKIALFLFEHTGDYEKCVNFLIEENLINGSFSRR